MVGGEEMTNHLVIMLYMVCKSKKPSGNIVNNNFDRQFSDTSVLLYELSSHSVLVLSNFIAYILPVCSQQESVTDM